jgi:hypothetical protein
MNSEDLIVIDLFCLHHGIEVSFISALQDHGMIDIVVIEDNKYFPLQQLAVVEKIIRLYYELDINLEGIDAIMNLLHQVDDIKSQLTIAQNRIAFYEK